MTDRRPTPWNDLVAQWKEKAAEAEPGAQRRIWEQIVTRLDTPPEHELEAVKPQPSRRRTVAWALGTGIAIGVFIALTLLELGVVP